MEPACPPGEDSVIYFDGVCLLCNGLVDFVISRDPQARYRYATLQSKRGQSVLQSMGLPANEFETFVLQEAGRSYVKSTAILRIFRKLSGLWPLLYLLVVVPKPLRDAVYGWIGKRRYKLFGRTATCRIPSEQERHLFLDLEPEPGKTGTARL